MCFPARILPDETGFSLFSTYTETLDVRPLGETMSPYRVVCNTAVLFFLATVGHASPAPSGPLAEAFLAQCQHTQTCALAELTANPDTDPALLQMIQSGMAGKCEAQLAQVSQYEGMPHAQTLISCYQAMSELPCEVLREGPEIAECN